MTIWHPDLRKYSGPRYKALAEAIAEGIGQGILVPGQKLPTHRSLAERLSVTVGTITRGYAEAERRDLVTARVGSGTFIRSDSGGVADFFIPEQEQEGLIDLSLSFAPGCGEERELSDTLKNLSRNPVLLQSLLGYQAELGLPRFRQAAARWLSSLGVETGEEDIVLCNGGQNAISIALQVLTRPGDRIVTEGFTYPGILSAVKQHYLRVTGVSLDEQGLIPEQLDACCRQYQPSVLYCTPTLHNPTSVTASLERRMELLDVAKKYDLVIIEDEVQAGLMVHRPPSLYSLCPERVIYISSCSKTLAGGLRVGYMVCPPRFMQRARMALRSSCWMVPPLMAEIATEWIMSGKAERMLRLKQAEIEKRHQYVKQIFQGLDYNSHPAAYNVWLKLPELWQSNEFVKQVERNGVLVKPATTFTAGRFQGDHGVRICVGSPSHHLKVKRGLEIIRDTLDERPDVVEPVI